MPRGKSKVKKYPSLTKFEERLLLHPPTKGTWVCLGKYKTYDVPTGKDIENVCNAVNVAGVKGCWMCGKARPQKPKVLWPLYEAACAKVFIEPGSGIFKKTSAKEAQFYPKGGDRWQTINLNDDLS